MREQLKRLSPKGLISCYQVVRYACITFLFHLFHLLPIKRKRVVFMNVWGYGDNARYVAEELCKRKTDRELFFICNHPPCKQVDSYITFVKNNSIKAILVLATAKVWVESNRKEAYIRKRKGQYYIQLWHGGVPLKKIEGDCSEYLGKDYIQRAKWDSAMTDLYISNGTFCTKMYRRAFFYSGKILEYGSPRMDLLLSKDSIVTQKIRDQIKKDLNIPKDARIALYAPTYRQGHDVSIYEMNYNQVITELTKKAKGTWYLILRLHPLVSNLSNELPFSEHVINGSSYRDMYELMKISDLLITDYSNTMFEFALMKKPVILYAKDAKDYQKERGFYFSMEELPFLLAKTSEELCEQIKKFDLQEEQKKVDAFFFNVGMKETGKASVLVADVIEKMTK